MFRHLIAAIILLTGSAYGQSQSQARDEVQRWRLPLADKEKAIQRNIFENHDVEGTYVPTVPLPPDFTTDGTNGDMHTSSWTGCYLMAISFRLGWARAHGSEQDLRETLDIGGHILHGVTILSRISGRPGLLARYIVYGHGVGSGERSVGNARNWWFQGKGEYSDFRYRSHPSHHNYHHMLRGLAYWYYFLQKDNPSPTPRERALMDSTRALVREMMEFAYKSNNMILVREDGSVSAQQILSRSADRPSTTALMATNSLKFGYWITGDRWYKAKYDSLVQRLGYKTVGTIPPDRWQGSGDRMRAPDWDDTEHTLGSLWLVYQLEEDPQLKPFYRMAVASIFDTKRTHKRTPFNYYYASVTGDTEGADLPGALETMRLFPSDWTLFPLMNSIRTDIEITGEGRARRSATLLPFNEQGYDNAYTWKGNPFSLDRYTAREIASMAVSAEDSMVWLLSDANGALYRSLDGGRSFQPHDSPPGVAVRSVTFAARKNRVAVIAADKGVYWTQGGGYAGSWHRADVGLDTGSVRQVMVDPDNPNVVWAVADNGVYRSEDLGIEEVGKAWERVSRPFPASGAVVYGAKPGANAVIYATSGGRIYRHSLGAAKWTVSPVDAEDYQYIPAFRRIVVAPDNPNVALFLLDLTVWGNARSLVLRTTDGGQTMRIVGVPSRGVSYIPAEGSGLERGEVTSLTFDPRNPPTVYAGSKNGLFRSTDGGVTWQPSNVGLRIPLAYHVFAPRELPGRILASTPAGLHESADRGQTWSPPILVLNGPGTRQVDRGGMGYLVGYWPGRYFGYITDEQATATTSAWGW